MVQKGRRNANTFERSRQEVEGRKMRKMRKRGWRRIKRGEGGRRRFLDRERILLTVARAEFGRVGGPANNAGLVFLNPRTNRHLSGAGEMAGHSARCGSRCSRAHLSLFFLFTRPSENDLTVPGARARARASGRPATARADPPMNYRPFQTGGTRGCRWNRPREKTAETGARDIGALRIRRGLRGNFGNPGYRN